MKLVQREECIVRGLTVRTSNRNETIPQQARIAGLWQDFFTACGRAGVEPSLVYGIYTNYGSDLHGEFDVTAALPGDFPHAAMREVTIPAGSYLCFTKSGPCGDSYSPVAGDLGIFSAGGYPDAHLSLRPRRVQRQRVGGDFYWCRYQRTGENMNIAVKNELVAACGLYCGACHRYTKGKCPGCTENVKATWCKIRTCTNENGYHTCAECTEFADVQACRKFNNIFAKIFALIFKSDRPASIKLISAIGVDAYAREMAEKGTPVLKKP